VPLSQIVLECRRRSAPGIHKKLDRRITEIEEKNGLQPGKIRLIPLLETTLGIENAFEIATASKRMEALYLGAEDLTADLRCARTKEGTEIAYARGRLVMAARAAGIEAYDTRSRCWDLEGLERDARVPMAWAIR
jgi:citrate lyase subunit beta/citryl-CoA lyase